MAFNKSETGNWAVLWHCEPPFEVLNRMLFVRVHLDTTGSDDRVMEIVPKSHQQGIIAASEAAKFASESQTEICENQIKTSTV
ncbi:hypothetical protein MNBD_ALPHA07-1304 [hydrothermal vent metagenome]|uniref:Uncharacterized protein n=1 Tax=hydrothermal vent metagenome TaxID=652676 RepID=A0A3B0SMW4_9ZZZZ